MSKLSLAPVRTTTFLRPAALWAAAIRALSDRLVLAQRPIRVLDTIKWDDATESAFFAAGARELPAINRDFYASRPLPFDAAAKKQELHDLERDVRRQLGTSHPAGRIILRMSCEYRQVIDLLLARGTPAFAEHSRKLYGTSQDSRGDSLGDCLSVLRQHAGVCEPDPDVGKLAAVKVVGILAARLQAFFGAGRAVRVRLSDGIVADAAAGCDYLKVRQDAMFTLREVRVLEVHEGWVHLGTTLNGQSQPVCTFLAKGPPSSTVTQEGLAVLTEFLSGAAHPARARRLANRVAAVAQAEAGANFRDVFRFFLGEGCDPRESYQHTVRLFRGSLPAGAGPFTKDLVYGRGLQAVSRFVGRAAANDATGLLSLLFCGKTHLDDLPALAQLLEEGLVAPPRFIPPPFADPANIRTFCRLMHS